MSVRYITAAVLAAPVVAAAATATAICLTGTHRRLGASEAESRRALPGDDLLPAAQIQNDRACTITAPPEDVWPWIAQLGQDRAGFYSFEVLENLVGCKIQGANRVHPEWQDVAIGDAFRLHPDVALRVAQVDPPRALVTTSQGGDAPGGSSGDTTWAFCLSPIDGPQGDRWTRLHLRERYETPGRAARAMIELTSVISAVMSWRMLTRLQSLAGPEGHTSLPSPSPRD